MDTRKEAYWMGVGSMLDDAVALLKHVREADRAGFRPSEVTEEQLPLSEINEPLAKKIDEFISLYETD